MYRERGGVGAVLARVDAGGKKRDAEIVRSLRIYELHQRGHQADHRELRTRPAGVVLAAGARGVGGWGAGFGAPTIKVSVFK
jgi:hypothetical protein